MAAILLGSYCVDIVEQALSLGLSIGFIVISVCHKSPSKLLAVMPLLAGRTCQLFIRVQELLQAGEENMNI